MAKPTEKRSLENTIEYAKRKLLHWDALLDDGYQQDSVIIRCDRHHLRRLVEAGEFEREFTKQAWWWRDRKCPDCAEKDRRIEKLRAAEDQITSLANYILEEVEGEPSRSEGAGECAIRIIKDLRSQLAEKERELERLRKSDGCRACQVCPYVTDLETAEKELKRLRGMLDRLLEQSDPPEIPALTEPEVEKVAKYLSELYHGGNPYWSSPTLFTTIARHVIERGYSPTDPPAAKRAGKNCRARREE